MKSVNKLTSAMNADVSRRGFLGGTAALGVTAASTSALMGKKAYAAKKGGHLRAGIAHGSTTDSLDPATWENGFSLSLDYTLFNHLGEVDHTGAVQPELAESWEASPDAKVWSFKLRKDVEFHNGKTLEASDVIASIEYHMGEDTKSAAKSLLTQVASMKSDGKNEVIIELKAGNADFPYVISDYHIAIKPAKNGKIDPTEGIGTGPYVLESYEPGVRMKATKNKNYFKPDRGHFDSVELITIIDLAARQNALTTGEIDMMDRADLKTVHLLKRSKGINVMETVGYKHYTMPMRTDTAPFDNSELRLALKYSLDREELVKKILRGHGVVGNDHPISPTNQYHAEGLAQRMYDPDKAKFHFKKAGMEGTTIQLSAADAAFPGAVDAAVLYKEHAAKAGIDIEVVREPNDGYWSNVWMKKGWCACYWGGRPTEDWMFTTAYAAGADWNDTYWKHDRFNELLLAARAELDSDKRRTMYYEMQEIVSNDGGVVVPMFANYVFAASDKILPSEQMAGNWEIDGCKFAERWSFA